MKAEVASRMSEINSASEVAGIPTQKKRVIQRAPKNMTAPNYNSTPCAHRLDQGGCWWMFRDTKVTLPPCRWRRGRRRRWAQQNQGGQEVRVGEVSVKCTDKTGFPVLEFPGRAKLALGGAKDSS